ncbi:MAG: YraN family protein [Verrucomicrobiota bacterium]
MLAQIEDWLLARPNSSPETGGEAGERCAADFLAAKGLRIVSRNWRNPKDRREEIDLICTDDGILVFVEVKARSASAKVPGYYTVNRRKKAVLLRACRAYLASLRREPTTYRFDVVEVATRADAAPEVLHFENVPLFP